MKQEKRKSREIYWQERVSAQKASGKPASAFCKEQGLSVHSFYFWKQRFNKKSTGRDSFIPVKAPLTPAAPSRQVEPLRVVFQNGATLYFAITPDPEWIQTLLKCVS
jgi:hypothetical protein